MQLKKIINLAILNLKTRKARTALTVLSMSVGIGVLFFFLSLSNAVKISFFDEISKKMNPRQLIVNYDYKNIGLFQVQENKTLRLNSEIADKIQKIEGVEKVSPQMTVSLPTVLEVDFWDKYFETDVPVHGLDFSFLNIDENEIDEEYLPVVVSERLLDVYNASMAENMGLPRLSEDGLIGRRLDLVFGKSSFFNTQVSKTKRVPAKIVGLSTLVPVMGLTVPLDQLNLILNEFPQKEQGDLKYSALYLMSVNPDFNNSIQKEIETMGFRVNSAQSAQEQIRQLLWYFETILKMLAIVILLIALFAMNNTLMMSIIERKQELGLLKALGMQNKDLMFLILFEAFFLGIFALIVGFIIAFMGGQILDIFLLKMIPDFSFKPQTLFIYNTSILFFVFGITFFFILLASFLPARKTTKLDPLDAMLK